MSPASRFSLLTQLRRQIATAGAMRKTDRPHQAGESLLLNNLLEAEHRRQGVLVDCLSCGPGSGASLLALLAARDRAPIVIVDEQREFFPAAAEALGLNPGSLLVVVPGNRQDALWTWEQSLRSPNTTVIGRLGALPVQVHRRLKLAVERGGGLGLMLRPLSLRSSCAWSDLRLIVTPEPTSFERARSCSRRLSVEVLHTRGRLDRRRLIVEIHDETASLSVVSELADPATASGSSRASPDALACESA